MLEFLLDNNTVRGYVRRYDRQQRKQALKAALVYGIHCLAINYGPQVSAHDLQQIMVRTAGTVMIEIAVNLLVAGSDSK